MSKLDPDHDGECDFCDERATHRRWQSGAGPTHYCLKHAPVDAETLPEPLSSEGMPDKEGT